MLPRFCLTLAWFLLSACGALEAPPSSPRAALSVSEPQPEPQREAIPTSSPRRMTLEETEALPSVIDSVCREYASETPRTLNRCEFLGPYPGEIAPPSSTSDRFELKDALLACHSDINCMGVSTDWYTGSQWYTVSHSSPFTPDPNSYGCSFVIRCP